MAHRDLVAEACERDRTQVARYVKSIQDSLGVRNLSIITLSSLVALNVSFQALKELLGEDSVVTLDASRVSALSSEVSLEDVVRKLAENEDLLRIIKGT